MTLVDLDHLWLAADRVFVGTPGCKVACRGGHRGVHLLEIGSLVADAAVRPIAICPGLGGQGAETDEQVHKVRDGLDERCDVKQFRLRETSVAGVVEQIPPIDSDEFIIQIILQLGRSQVRITLRGRYVNAVRGCGFGEMLSYGGTGPEPL